MATVEEIVNTLKRLEREIGSTPSVSEIAKEADVSPATAHKYLRQGVKDGVIVQRDGKFMSLEVARAFGRK